MDGVIYYSDLSGYKIIGYDQAGGKEYHRLFFTSDYVNIWNEIDTDIDIVYPHMVTGIIFLNKSVGFLFYRYGYIDLNPAILLAIDGGTTWTKQTKICEFLSDHSLSSP